jgi:hypothetical protein
MKHQRIVGHLYFAPVAYLRNSHAGEAFVRVAEVSAEHADMLTTPLLPGFSVKLAEVFESTFPA